VADHKAVAYTVGAVVVVVTGAGAVYYFNSTKTTSKKDDAELGDEKSEAGKKKKRKAKKDKKGDKSGDSDDGAAGTRALFLHLFLKNGLLFLLLSLPLLHSSTCDVDGDVACQNMRNMIKGRRKMLTSQKNRRHPL